MLNALNHQVFPIKAPKLTPNPAALARQDTIDETVEGDHSPLALRERGHLQQRSSLERQSTDREPFEQEVYDSGIRETASSLAQRDLITSVMDMKVDMRLEMQRMAQRIGRMEDLLSELVKRTHESSGHTSPEDAIPVITTIVVSTTPPDPSSPNDPKPPPPPPMIIVPSTSSAGTVAAAQPTTLSITSASSSGSGLGPILLRKRRSKTRKAPAPPVSSPEQTRLLDAEMPAPGTSGRKREFL